MNPDFDHPKKEDDQHRVETLKPFAAIALPSPVDTSTAPIDEDDRALFPYSVEKAEAYFLNAGYIVSPRTIAHYCQTNRFQCKKFSSDGVRRWLIKESSIARHLKRLKRDQPSNASERKPSHAKASISNAPIDSVSNARANTSASDSSEHTATAMFNVKYVKFLEEQVSQKDSQLASLQAQADQVTKLTNGLGRLLLNQSEQPSDNNTESYQS